MAMVKENQNDEQQLNAQGALDNSMNNQILLGTQSNLLSYDAQNTSIMSNKNQEDQLMQQKKEQILKQMEDEFKAKQELMQREQD